MFPIACHTFSLGSILQAMETLTFVGASDFPPSVPLRIIIDVESTLLHHFDESLAVNLDRNKFRLRDKGPLTHNLARMAINTCLGPDVDVPETKEAYMGHVASDEWQLVLQVDCSVPSDEDDPPVVYFESKQKVNDDGNVEFISVIPRTAAARVKYHDIFHRW